MEKASELNPNDPQIWLLWGNIKRKSSKIKEADEMYKKANQLSPDNHIILNAYGQTRGRLGDYPMALELLEKALNTELSISSRKHEIINRTSIAEALIGWSEVLFRDRDSAGAESKLLEALEQCNMALKVDNSDLKTLGGLTKTYYKLGKHYNKVHIVSEAINYFNKAININRQGLKY
jgi:tetratricopeptide (TPR) repeat protein